MYLTPHSHCDIVDGLVFLSIFGAARRRGRNLHPGIPSLLESILRDATINFVIVFVLHLVFLMFLTLAPVSDTRYI
jgi:hypothetical protein